MLLTAKPELSVEQVAKSAVEVLYNTNRDFANAITAQPECSYPVAELLMSVLRSADTFAYAEHCAMDDVQLSDFDIWRGGIVYTLSAPIRATVCPVTHGVESKADFTQSKSELYARATIGMLGGLAQYMHCLHWLADRDGVTIMDFKVKGHGRWVRHDRMLLPLRVDVDGPEDG